MKLFLKILFLMNGIDLYREVDFESGKTRCMTEDGEAHGEGYGVWRQTT